MSKRNISTEKTQNHQLITADKAVADILDYMASLR